MRPASFRLEIAAEGKGKVTSPIRLTVSNPVAISQRSRNGHEPMSGRQVWASEQRANLCRQSMASVPQKATRIVPIVTPAPPRACYGVFLFEPRALRSHLSSRTVHQ